MLTHYLYSRNTAIGVEVYMVNTKRGRFTSAFWRSFGVFLLSVPLSANAQTVTISNGVPAGTVGSFRADVETGGGARTVFITAARFDVRDTVDIEILRNYYNFVDPGNNGSGSRLLGSPPVPDPNNPNIVTSAGALSGANGNVISWTAVSSIAPGAQVLTNTYTFIAATGVLGPLRFLQHLDKNTTSVDVFSHIGSAVGGDLKLFTFDNTDVYGLSHSGTLLPGTGLQNASFTGWAADHFDNIVNSIFTAGQPVSPDGIIANLSSFQHPQLGRVFGPADIVSVLAWDAAPNATSAVITTSLGAVPISVEVQPLGNLLVGNQLRCRGKECRFRARCILSPSPAARCTNQINVTVTKKALRSRVGPTVKAPGVLFASGAADIAPGQNATVRLRLTKRGRNFVRSTAKKRIKGTLEIESNDGVAVAFRARIRLN
jgi:hypothetical protein